MWKLRRADDLIGRANSIVGVGQGEVDGKDVEFEEFEALLASKACGKSTAFDQLNDGLDAKLLMGTLLL